MQPLLVSYLSHVNQPPLNYHLESVDWVLSTARSIRRNLDFDRPLDTGELLDCIDIATQAPTGTIGETWRFVIVTDPARKARLSALYAEVLNQFSQTRGLQIKSTQAALVNRLHEIPAMIFVCAGAPPATMELGGQIGYFGSILPAAWSLMLALRARHIGATWTSLLASRQTEVAEILEMPPETIHLVMLPVGYMKGATLKKAERVAAREITYVDAWGRPPAAD